MSHKGISTGAYTAPAAASISYSFDPHFLSASMDQIRYGARDPKEAHEHARQAAPLLGCDRYWVIEFDAGGEAIGGACYFEFMGKWRRAAYGAVQEADINQLNGRGTGGR